VTYEKGLCGLRNGDSIATLKYVLPILHSKALSTPNLPMLHVSYLHITEKKTPVQTQPLSTPSLLPPPPPPLSPCPTAHPPNPTSSRTPASKTHVNFTAGRNIPPDPRAPPLLHHTPVFEPTPRSAPLPAHHGPSRSVNPSACCHDARIQSRCG
jgi:hypothetical protein